MHKTLDYQLYRFGQAYAHWGVTPEEIIQRECEFKNRPWWWLRFLGWHIDKRIDLYDV